MKSREAALKRQALATLVCPNPSLPPIKKQVVNPKEAISQRAVLAPPASCLSP